MRPIRPLLRTFVLVCLYFVLGLATLTSGGCGVIKQAAISAAPTLLRFGGCVVKCLSIAPVQEPSSDERKPLP